MSKVSREYQKVIRKVRLKSYAMNTNNEKDK